jgi:predicted HTH domain antitoxin
MAELIIRMGSSLPVSSIPEEHWSMAERKAREAFVMTLLREGDISAGRAAELLAIDRWTLSQLMYEHGISPFVVSNTTPISELAKISYR